MKVIQISAKSKSPKNEINIINRILNSKVKNSSKNTKTRNFDFSSNYSKKKNIFKRILPYNNFIHFSSNNCTSTNTTNFNNSKTNNFIFFDHDFNFKDNNILNQQIKSLIKHHSSNNFLNYKTSITNVKFMNNSKYKADKEMKKNKDKERNKSNKSNEDKNNNTDIFSYNKNDKNDKLYVNTNYSILLNNTRKEKENDKKIFTKIFKFYNSRPMTLNFSNEINNFNSYKMLLNNNKSMKYLNKRKPNYRKKLSSNENLSRFKNKGNSESKESKKKGMLIDGNTKIKGSKSYNILFTIKKDKLSNSTSFSPINKKKKKTDSKKKKTNLKQFNNKSLIRIKNNSIERIQINLCNKKTNVIKNTNVKKIVNNNNNKNKPSGRKYPSVKSSENLINFQFFNRIDNKKGKKTKNNSNKKKSVIFTKKRNNYYLKKVNESQNENKKIKNRNNNNIEKKVNNTFIKISNKHIINNENTCSITPEENHFLAIKQIQQINKNNDIFK